MDELAGLDLPNVEQDIADALQSGTEGRAKSRIASTASGSANYNRLPSNTTGPCTPFLLAYCFDGDSFNGRLNEIANHAGILCPDTQEVLFITTQWKPRDWKKIETSFGKLGAHVTILLVARGELIRIAS